MIQFFVTSGSLGTPHRFGLWLGGPATGTEETMKVLGEFSITATRSIVAAATDQGGGIGRDPERACAGNKCGFLVCWWRIYEFFSGRTWNMEDTRRWFQFFQLRFCLLSESYDYVQVSSYLLGSLVRPVAPPRLQHPEHSG